MKQINLGIVGAGEHMRRAHGEAMSKIDRVNFLRWFDPAIADTDIDSYLGTKSSYEEVLEDPEIDAVIIASPDRFHPDQFLAAISAGKHVFIEKPLALDSDGFEKIVKGLRIAKEKNLIVSSCHPRRFDPPMVALKELLDNGKWVEENLGKINRFEFKFLYHQVTDSWKQDRSLMLDHFGHEIDLVRYLFGRLDKQILVSAKKIRDGFAAYTTEGVIDEIEFIFDGMRILDEKKYQEYVEIRGTLGIFSLYLNGGIAIYNSQKEQKMLTLPAKSYEDMFNVVNENFIAAIRGTEKPYLDYYDFLINNYSGICLLENGTFSTASDLDSYKDLI
jgi:predicted dehydrogenase